MGQNLVGLVGLVTTSIPPGGLGEVRLPVSGGTTFSAYSANRGVAIPTGTRVTVTEHYPPRTIVVTADG